MLRESDVRAIIRLLGEVSIASDDLLQKKRCLLSGLCELVDGDTWTWSLDHRAKKNGAALCLDDKSGGRRAVPPLNHSLTLNWISPEAPQDLALGKTNAIRLKLAARQIIDDVVSSIRIVRRSGRPPFSAREVKMAQIVLSEIPWLHEQNPPAGVRDVSTKLSPRQRTVLAHLIDGLSRQAIAERLRISPHTVHGYIKVIFKHYSINSRADLMRQFTLGRQRKLHQ